MALDRGFSHCEPSLSVYGATFGPILHGNRTAPTITIRDLTDLNAYKLFGGAESQLPLGGLLTHVVTHGAYHRGQIAWMVRKLGGIPPATDYLYFLQR